MKSKILFVISLLTGLMFLNAGLNKFFNFMPPPDDMPEELMRIMGAFMEIGWLLPLVGIVEIVGGILIIFPKTRALGALVIFPVMVGILLTHIVNAPEGLPVAVPLFLAVAWIMIESRDKYASLFD